MSINDEYNEGDYQPSGEYSQEDSIESMREKLEQLTEEEKKIHSVSASKQHATSEYDPEVAAQSDVNSIYIGNVDYSVTAADLETFFSKCGKVVRVTLPENARHTSHKGYAYLEFASEDSVIEAFTYDKTELKGRQLSILPKRTNVANYNRGRGRGGSRGRGRGRGGNMMMSPPMLFNMPPNMYMFPMMPTMPMVQSMQQFQPQGRNNNFNRGRGQGRQTYRPKPYDKQ